MRQITPSRNFALDALVITTEHDVKYTARERVVSGKIDPKKIKSAKRVLEIFEFFGEQRQSATVMEIARELGYPQSSTSELLSCLVELGFLHRDRAARTYRPTARVAMLSAWVHPRLMRQGDLFRMMDGLAAETHHRVILAGTTGLNVQHIHVIGQGPQPSGRDRPGPILHGALGHLLLSVYDYGHIRKIVHRLNAEAACADDRVNVDDLLREVEGIKRRGYAATPGLENAQGGVCAVLLPQTTAEEPLALGIVMGQGEGDVEQALRALRNAVALHLGPVLAHCNGDVIEPLRQSC